MTDTRNPSKEELWQLVQTFSEHAQKLEQVIAIEQEKNAALNTENAGWIEIYQRQQSEIAVLKAELSRLESRIRALPIES